MSSVRLLVQLNKVLLVIFSNSIHRINKQQLLRVSNLELFIISSNLIEGYSFIWRLHSFRQHL